MSLDDAGLSMTTHSEFPTVARFLFGWFVLFLINSCYDYRILGYVTNTLLLCMKLFTLFVLRIEPFEALIVVKTFSVIPFLYALHYYRHDSPEKSWLGRVLIGFVLAANIAEPSLIKEFKQGVYLNAITGLMMAVYTIYPGSLGVTVKRSDSRAPPNLVATNLGWGWVLSYTIWHICLFYGQAYKLSSDDLTFLSNYFIFDTWLCLFPLVPCVVPSLLSSTAVTPGPERWIQARANSLGIKLAFNFLWTSSITPAWWIKKFYTNIHYSASMHFWFQIFAFGIVSVTMLVEVGNYRKKQKEDSTIRKLS